jgi:hypothetical protein
VHSRLLTIAQTCRARDVQGTSTLIVLLLVLTPRTRPHRFIPVVVLLVRPTVLLLVVLLLAPPRVVGRLTSPREISGSPRLVTRHRAFGLELVDGISDDDILDDV